MAGRIKESVIDRIREQSRIDEIVGEYLQLKPAGTNRLKGLCPFHDEKTPSFTVSPYNGRWHCFGACGEGGDVFSFIERIENISFLEAVELLAEKLGIEIEYEQGRAEDRDRGGVKRSRLVDAHKVAKELYRRQLRMPQAKEALQLLYDRGFDDEAIDRFEIGYSLPQWDCLLGVLRKKGFTEKEIAVSGLGTQSARGMYDRFRGRLMWPIHSITGDPIGFGARKTDDGEEGPKYLNTAETPIYKKSQVLYGLNMAKAEIAGRRQIVIVEGYTDVMAAHLAGITNAVATCGTAFGSEHAKIIRRLIGDIRTPDSGTVLHDGSGLNGEIIYTFDGDNAGQKAALKAYGQDGIFGVQTYVAVAPHGMDPCEVRLNYGDEAVREFVKNRKPLFEFVLRSLLSQISLSSPEGRTAALYRCVPVLAEIKDDILRMQYVQTVAGWLNLDGNVVRENVQRRMRMRAGEPREITASEDHCAPEEGEKKPVLKPFSQISDPAERVERAVLQVMVQMPLLAQQANAGSIPSAVFTVPIHRNVCDTVQSVGAGEAYLRYLKELTDAGVESDVAERRANTWYVQQLLNASGEPVTGAVRQLAAEPIAQDDMRTVGAYVNGVMGSLIRQALTRQIAEGQSQLRLLPAEDPKRKEVLARIEKLRVRRAKYDETDF